MKRQTPQCPKGLHASADVTTAPAGYIENSFEYALDPGRRRMAGRVTNCPGNGQRRYHGVDHDSDTFVVANAVSNYAVLDASRRSRISSSFVMYVMSRRGRKFKN